MKDFWSYDKKKRFAYDGTRWHFVSHHMWDSSAPIRFELFFRADDRSQYGVLRFARGEVNPYRNYDTMVTKIMNNATFPTSCWSLAATRDKCLPVNCTGCGINGPMLVSSPCARSVTALSRRR